MKRRSTIEKKVRKMSYQTLKNKLDKVFSVYIRTRDSIFTTQTTEGFLCITCGRYIPINKGDCGHFNKRQHMKTRWEEKNCHAQCKGCNNFEQGAQHKHGKVIDRLYGAGTADMLLSFKGTHKYYCHELEAMIELYTKKISALLFERPIVQIVQTEGE